MPTPKLKFRPLTNWDHTSTELKEYGQFKATISDTIWLIEDEIRKLGGDSGVLELDFPARCFGGSKTLPGPGSSPNSSRVRLSFYHPELGLLRYPCDTYFKWTHNVRAIALTLEALRAIDRYGAAQQGAQYKGWQQLPAGESSTAANDPTDQRQLLLPERRQLELPVASS